MQSRAASPRYADLELITEWRVISGIRWVRGKLGQYESITRNELGAYDCICISYASLSMCWRLSMSRQPYLTNGGDIRLCHAFPDKKTVENPPVRNKVSFCSHCVLRRDFMFLESD